MNQIVQINKMLKASGDPIRTSDNIDKKSPMN